MKLGCTLLWIIFVSSIGFGANLKAVELHFHTCLRQALRKSSPPARDNAKFICLEKFVSIPFSSCLKEARRMEYLSNSEEALKSCYYSRSLVWNTRNCLNVAKKLHTVIDRDRMRLDCFSQLDAQQMSRKNCLLISESFEQTHYKERFKQVCEENE